MLEWVMIAAYSLIGLALLLLAILSLNLSIIVGLHLFHRRRGLAVEAALLARPLPPDTALPRVVVQLPGFNERHVIDRLIESSAAIDWPRDRLAIQGVADSTDETTPMA